MTTKPTPKFSKIFTKNFIQKSKVILLGIMIASLFLPVFGSVDVVKAQIANPYGNGGRGPSSTPATATYCNLDNPISKVIESNKDSLAWNETFDAYVKVEIDKTTADLCEKSGSKDFVFTLGFDNVQYTENWPAIYFNEGGKYGFHALITGLSIKKLWGTAPIPEAGTLSIVNLYAYYKRTSENLSGATPYTPVPAKIKLDNTVAEHSVKKPFPSFPGPPALPKSSSAGSAISTADSVSGEKLGIKFLNDNGKGLRDKYRMAMTDTTAMTFGTTKGLDGIIVDWSESSPKLIVGQTITLSKENDTTGLPNTDPLYSYSNVAFTAGDTKWDPSKACAGAVAFSQTCEILFYQNSNSNKDKGNWDPNGRNKVLTTSPVTLNPVLNPVTWKKKEFVGKKSVNGAPVGSVEFFAVPLVIGKSSFNGSESVYVMGKNAPKFTIEVYENEQQIVDACKKENAGNESICTVEYSRYNIGKVLEQSTTSSSTNAETSAAGELFSFIRKIIAYLVLLITSFVYWIFSTILVPILVALIQVHPYKDEFVNFVYPGWIIVRNISNIAFIVALLYMGMKILFQQEDASKSRGFIVTLILMALLVNFSLVIGQGIVAIADTVQAQFLPEDSKVIETLGHKLMVDPIIIFRGGEGSLTSGGNFTADAAASDLPKAIVLLVLSLAAFFSFVALIAFMFVRLVALWVLYMVSPLAYVGRILPETKSYASQWWQEFMKYAFSVPIMAFFLNIAALVAVTFSAQSGDQVQVQGARGYLFGNATAGITEFALTTVSHFIVLLFIYAGMQYALKFGGVGAKQIVGFAKKGFDAVTQKMPKEYLKSQYARKIEGGMLDPKAWAKSWRDRVATTDKNMRAERLSRKANRLSPSNILPPEGSLITRAGHIAKYLGSKAVGLDPHKELIRAAALRDKASILTDDEREELEKEQRSNNTSKAKIENEQTLLEDNKLTNTRAKKYKDEIDDRLDQIEARRIDLTSRQGRLKRQGKVDGEEYKNNERELKGMITDEAKLREAKTAILDARSRSPVRGEVELNPTDISKLSLVFNPEDLKVELSEDIKKVEGKADTYTKQLKEDDDRKKKYGVTSITDDEKRELEKQAMEMSLEASQRYMPASYAAIEARRSLQADQAKKVEHMDDVDELVEAFQGAMKKNNMPFATEIAKKLAKMGGMDELLKKNGYNNNLKEFQQFIDKSFAKMAPQVRLQIGSEISTIAKSNGNLTLGNSNQYKYNVSSGESVINWAKPEQSKRKLNAKLKGMSGEALAKLEKTDFTEERGGVHYLHQGFIDALNGLGVNGMNGFLRNLPASKMNHIRKAKNLGEIRDQVRARLV